MRAVWPLLGAAIICGCIAALLIMTGYEPRPNPNFTNIQLPTLDTP